jgi:hypothetical protein
VRSKPGIGEWSRYVVAAATLVAIGLISELASAWGPVGHETIARVAEDNLTPKARAEVAAILGPDSSLASVSNWADQIRHRRPETAPWHFIDLDARAPIAKSDEPAFCKGHDCVVDQIEIDIATLRSAKSPRSRKLEALRFLVHLVGDLHQPLHCADDADRGGNDKIVRFVTPGSRSNKGTKIKLHALWDHLIEVRASEDPRELASVLERAITGTKKAEWSKGTLADWAWESYRIARDSIYAGLSPGPDRRGNLLPANYYAAKRVIVETQLEKGGIRLAELLNAAFGR